MLRLQHLCRMLGALLLFAMLFTISMQASAAPATHISGSHAYTTQSSRVYAQPFNTDLPQSQQGEHSKHLAATVNVLASVAPTTILQFSLVPSGIKAVFPDATALVTILRGNRDSSTSDTVTIDVQKMPPNTTFTIFFIEIASKPFGHVEYVADLTTRGDGSGESIFRLIALVAFAMDARNPGSSQDQEGTAPGINLEHLGMWFASLQDAQKILNDNTLKGTIFDGGNPPLHAGPQAMTDGQTDPVF